MATATRHSEPQTPAAAPEAERRSAPRGLPQAILGLQRTAGNAAVARAIAPRAIQRCGANCGCASCGDHEEDLLDERTGAGLLRAAVQRRST